MKITPEENKDGVVRVFSGDYKSYYYIGNER